MAKAGKILVALVVAFLVACSTKYSEVAPDTVLSVRVVNESTNQVIPGATVCIYDDSVAFKNTISSVALPSGFVASLSTNDSGIAVIPRLKSTVQYYVYAYYQDNTIISGTYITLDNSAKQFHLKNILPQGSVTSATILVRPSDGFIVFWTQNSNNAALPINVFVGNNGVGSVTQGYSFPSAFQAGSVSARARAGNNVVEGKSSSGCYWTNQLNLKGGSIIYYGLADCSVGTVAFYTDNLNSSVLPIQITLNANDGIGSISAVVSSVPANCSALNLVAAARVPGNYTYQAVSSTGNCVWNGAFVLTAGGCNLIYLTKCN